MAVKKQAAGSGFNLGDLSGYSSGGVLPEGDYVWKDLTVQMFQGTKTDGSPAGPARLGVMITMAPLGGGEDINQFYSFGSKAHESWAPNPDTGKGIVPVPGGPGTPPNASTNWAVLVKSLQDSGLPNGVLSDDLSVLEGMWVHMANVPEPEGRKAFISKTGESAVEDKPRTIAVVSEIKDDGKPWEGTGGIPEAAPAPKVKPNGSAKPAATATLAQRATAPATPASAGTDDGVEEAALAGISTVLEKSPTCLKLQLRTGTFKAVKEAVSQEMAQKVINTYFSSDAQLSALLEQLGSTLKGQQVVQT
ncbi:hypothetical protein KGP36_03405 [Patescibacteria group bacterium]|nr:hypothetical protein [Patescibacteria group bacterium]